MNSTSVCSCFCILKRVNRLNVAFSTSNLVKYSKTTTAPQVEDRPNNSTHYPSKSKNSRKEFNTPSKIARESELKTLISSNKNNPDNFGTLSNDWASQQLLSAMPDEEDDVIEQEYLHNRDGKTRLTIPKYGRIMKQFIKQKKIGLALQVLETRMMKEDKVKPDNYIYNLLIGACGEVGYTKKAFNLYKQMRVRQLKITGHTYTGLFNACANCPYPEEGLERAAHLRSVLIEKCILLNPIIYHSMIKAFGRCGDMETAFLLVDEMLEKKLMVSDETFNFLLQACITDKTAGFRQALLVWRKMMEKRVRPNLFSFNLLLRCSRDCSMGDEATNQQVIQVLLQDSQVNTKIRELDASSDKVSSKELLVTDSNRSKTLPNLISPQPTMGSVVAMKDITTPEHRLMLMGGQQGVLELMNSFRIKPDVKTFTQLLDQIPSTLEAEERLLSEIKKSEVPMDVDFYNMLIRKRSFRFDYDKAKDVLKLIQQDNLRPDILTFGVLAITCNSISRARQLLKDINNVGYRPNVEILGTLLKNACYARDCDYVLEIMKTLRKEELKPNEKFLKHLDNFYRFATDVFKKQETDNTGMLKIDRFKEYCKYYQLWRRNVTPEETPPDPWNQFKEPHAEPEDLELLNFGKVKLAK